VMVMQDVRSDVWSAELQEALARVGHRFGRRPEGTDAGLRPWSARQPNYRPSPADGNQPTHDRWVPARRSLARPGPPRAHLHRQARCEATVAEIAYYPAYAPVGSEVPEQHDRRLIAYTTSRDTT
jgi:hypothetical protein